MAELLFITPKEITETTLLGGNVDIDNYVFCVADAQISVIEPLVGTELYNYLIDNYATLGGLYLELMIKFIKPITKHTALAKYLEIASFRVENGGIFKNQPENAQIVEQTEALFLADKYNSFAQMYVLRFKKWINKNNITEYKTSQDEVNASNNINLNSGWYFGKDENLNKDYGKLDQRQGENL